MLVRPILGARIPSSPMPDEEIEQGQDAVVERLRALTDELESLASDRGLISALSPAERTRLLNAAGDLYEPDVARRRQSGKAARRRAKASKLQRDEAVLSETGIRPYFDLSNTSSAFLRIDWRCGSGNPNIHSRQVSAGRRLCALRSAILAAR